MLDFAIMYLLVLNCYCWATSVENSILCYHLIITATRYTYPELDVLELE